MKNNTSNIIIAQSKKYLREILTLSGIIFLLTMTISCSKKLDLQPLDSFSQNDVWSDPKLTETFVNQLYDQVVYAYKDGGFGWAAQTDELYGNFNWTNENLYVRGEATPDNQSSVSINFWDKLYGAIRYANLFLKNIDQVNAVGNDAVIKRMKGEVYFLRALANFELLKRFGGVPIITEVYDVNNKTFNESRATWDETKDFILSDIAEAAQLLPEDYPSADKGRATKGAALALKSRLLLYAASPYFNNSGDITKWQAAKAAAREVMDMGLYALYGDVTSGTYNNTFLDFFNLEVIFSRVYNGVIKADRYNTVDRDLSPNGYNGYSAYNVLQQMVDEFEMVDGTKFDWNNPVHNSNPYANREPRFYSDILFNGSSFKGRPAEFYEGGLDSPGSPYSPWNASKTRYTIRKMVDENHNWDVQESNTTQWVIFRLSEIYLNYAEACAELGETAEALTYLNKIRTEKAGMQAVTVSGNDDLVQKIRHERRIELCFEGHRYFDIRRWGIAEIGSEDGKGVIIRMQPNNSFTYEVMTVQNRQWVPSFYFYPIPRTEIQKNPAITQNAGY